MRCAMCGYEFETSELTCHGGCPLGAHCMVICCPRCGYSTVDPARSNLARRFANLFQSTTVGVSQKSTKEIHSRKGSTDGSLAVGIRSSQVRLLDMKSGESGHIADVGIGGEVGGENADLAHLSQYGLLPGTPVRLIQMRPVPIVQVGQTELALDHSVAARIFVDL